MKQSWYAHHDSLSFLCSGPSFFIGLKGHGSLLQHFFVYTHNSLHVFPVYSEKHLQFWLIQLCLLHTYTCAVGGEKKNTHTTVLTYLTLNFMTSNLSHGPLALPRRSTIRPLSFPSLNLLDRYLILSPFTKLKYLLLHPNSRSMALVSISLRQ